jgi:hypothetical protein
MAVDKFGNWDGVCACGKRALDGVKCRYGATHLRGFSDGIGKPKRVRERLEDPPPKRKRERLDLFDDDDD